MNRTTSDPGSREVCAGPEHWWQRTNSETQCDKKYYSGITTLQFAEPTKDPRPIDITLDGNVCYHVSLNQN